ncbi:MAG TPA: cupin domain-containing protein [Pseudonocardia sp.]|nr:cupin domain-containing protein [Pseudonocardia sp.]
MADAPSITRRGEIAFHHISPGDTVKLAVLAGPATGSPTTVVLEVWEPGGAQPPNSHAESSETFVVLAGRATAHSDDEVVHIEAGDTLTLLPGSVHRIVNGSATDRLYTLTVMQADGGFAEMITRGPRAALDERDLAVLGAVLPMS